MGWPGGSAPRSLVLLVDEDAILRPGQRALDKQLVAVTGAFLVNEKASPSACPGTPWWGLPLGEPRILVDPLQRPQPARPALDRGFALRVESAIDAQALSDDLDARVNHQLGSTWPQPGKQQGPALR